MVAYGFQSKIDHKYLCSQMSANIKSKFAPYITVSQQLYLKADDQSKISRFSEIVSALLYNVYFPWMEGQEEFTFN